MRTAKYIRNVQKDKKTDEDYVERLLDSIEDIAKHSNRTYAEFDMVSQPIIDILVRLGFKTAVVSRDLSGSTLCYYTTKPDQKYMENPHVSLRVEW